MVLDSHYTNDLLEAGVDEVARGCLAGPVLLPLLYGPETWTLYRTTLFSEILKNYLEIKGTICENI